MHFHRPTLIALPLALLVASCSPSAPASDAKRAGPASTTSTSVVASPPTQPPGPTVADLSAALAADRTICPDSVFAKTIATYEASSGIPGPFTLMTDLNADGALDAVGFTQCRTAGYDWTWPLVALISGRGLVDLDDAVPGLRAPDAFAHYFPTRLEADRNGIVAERTIPAGQLPIDWTYKPPTTPDAVPGILALRYSNASSGFTVCHPYGYTDDSDVERCPGFSPTR